MAALPPLLPGATRANPPEYLVAIALAAGSAAATGFARSVPTGAHRRGFDVAVSAVLVAWTLLNLWAPLVAGGLPVRGYGSFDAAKITAVPQPGTYVNDDAIYRRVYHLMHASQPYYQSFRDAWLGLRTKPPLPNSVTGYRLPSFFWLWRLLPSNPFSIVYLYLVLCSIGVVSAACIAGQLAGARFAPLAAVALAAYAMGVGVSEYVMYVDLPSASVALAGIALFVRARLTGSRPVLWAAAGVMVLAALTREILAYYIVLAAVAAFVESRGDRLRQATPWLAALGLFAIGYAAHTVAAWPYLSLDGGRLSYLGGSPAFVVDGLTRFAVSLNGGGAALATIFAVGVIAGYAAHRRVGWPFSAFALAALVLPMLAMMRVGNPGIDASGHQVNYWGMLVIPLGLSLWPAWVLLLQPRTVGSSLAR